MEKPLKVICFGMGAIGTYIGGSLAAKGADVTFIEKEDLVENASSQGIRLNIGGELIKIDKVNVTADISAALSEKPVDVALLAVKSFDTPSVLDSIQKYADRFPPILCLQNGVENEGLIEEKLGKGKVIAGTITSAVGRSGLGDIRLEKLRGVGIENTHQLSQTLIDWFNQAGLKAKGYGNRADMKWSKMLTNLMANATSAILNWTPGQVFSDAVTWNIELEQLREALRVMKAMDIHLVDLPGTPVIALLTLLNSLPAGMSRWLIGKPLAKGRGAKMPSFHIDLYSGKTISEVTYLNGAVVRYAERAGLKAQVNERLCVLLEQLASGAVAKEEYADQPLRLERWIRNIV